MPVRRTIHSPTAISPPSTTRIGSQTIRNQIPALASDWRIEIMLAAASSTTARGSQPLAATSVLATTGTLNRAVRVA